MLAARTTPDSTGFFPIRTLWTLALNNALAAPPAYSDTTAFFSIEGGRLVAYDLATGSQLWLTNIDTRLQPAVGDGLVFAATDEDVIALHAADGREAWRLPLRTRLALPLVWDNGWLIAADASGTVVAFLAVDGREIWRRNIAARAHASPALAADRVYVATDDARLLALQVTTGDVVWERRLGGPANDLVALDEELFFGAADNFFYALDAHKGAVLWRWQTGGDVIGRAALDDARVYFVSLDNLLRALSRKTGAQLWKRALPMRPTSGALLAGTTLLVAGLDPTLHAYSSKDGAPATDIKADNVIAAPPSLVHPPSLPEPLLLYVASDLVSGATVIAATHSPDPPIAPALAPLPSIVKP